MKKAVKALVKFATDGGAKTCSHCPFDLDLPCPRAEGECLLLRKGRKKFIRECWRMVLR